MNIKKVTPLVYVEEIEPCLGFWEKVGFTKKLELPQGEKLGFVILEQGDIEIMYQTRDSVAADVPEVAASAPMRGTFLYIEVNDLNAIEQALAGVQPVIPRRTTFYGADELVVRDPAGNVVSFAQYAPS